MLIRPSRFIRESRRTAGKYVWSTPKRDALQSASQDDMLSKKGLRFEKPRKREETVHDIIQKYRERGIHLKDL
jgi:hypothetical protein